MGNWSTYWKQGFVFEVLALLASFVYTAVVVGVMVTSGDNIFMTLITFIALVVIVPVVTGMIMNWVVKNIK